MTQDSDNELMQRVLVGDDDAFAELVTRYNRLVYYVALKIVQNGAEAQDATQMAWLDAWRARAQFDPAKGCFKAWLLNYAYTRAFNRANLLKSRGFYDSTAMEPREPQHMPRRMTAIETARYIEELLAQLTPQQREAIRLIGIEGLTLQEAADKAGVTLPVIRHGYYKGQEKLRKTN